MMTNEQYFNAVCSVENYTDRDAYVSALAAAEMWGDAENAPIPADRIADLGAIWDAAHRTVKDVAKAAGMSVRQLGLHFAIPRRTIENWSGGVAEAPIYTLLVMQEALGLLDVKRK